MQAGFSRIFLLAFFVVAASVCLPARESAFPTANSDLTYQQLRNVTLSSEAVSVKNFTLRRDAGIFYLSSGTFCFVNSVAGEVTGAVFTGDGSFELNPPDDAERASLKLLTREGQFHEIFDRAVFRFTDSTYDELKKAGATSNGPCDVALLRESQNVTRRN
jgi:hypothetical protein